MMNRFAGQLSSIRKLYPAALGVVVTYGFLVLCRVSVPLAEAAQTSAAPSPPFEVAPARAGFEVASIKPSRSSGADPIVRPMSNGIRATSVTLVMLVQSAYIHTRFMDDLVAGVPSWANSDRFDIEARVDTGTANDLKKLSPDERELKLDLMLQTLLSDRFKLAIHKKTKEASAYQLIVGKNGVKLRPGPPIDSLEQMTTGMIRMTSGSITAQDVSMERLATALSAPLERPIIDRTGLPAGMISRLNGRQIRPRL